MMVSRKAWDVIVVGGGLVGSASAYALAKAGARTLLVEKGMLACGASGANFGNVQVQDSEFGLSLELTLEGSQRCSQLEAELDCDLRYRKNGSLLLIENERQWTSMEQRAAHLRKAGLAVELLDQGQVCKLEPYLSPQAVIGALYHPEEAQLNPFKLIHAFVNRGRMNGLEVLTATEVTGFRVVQDKLTGVDTPDGDHNAGNVLLAAGAWTRDLGRRLGLELPLQWVHGEAMITEPLGNITQNAMSSASFFEDSGSAAGKTIALAMNQRRRGNLMLGEAVTVTEKLGRDVAGDSIGGIAAVFQRWFPRLSQAAILRGWGIPVAFTSDNLPLLGAVEPYDNLFVAAGLKSTIVLAAVLGDILAEMITGQGYDPRLAAFSSARTLKRGQMHQEIPV